MAKKTINRRAIKPLISSSELKKPKKFYQDVGLLEDPNKLSGLKIRKGTRSKKEQPPSKFVQDLEKEANKPRKKRFKFGKTMSEELEYYVSKYGTDYEAMARDKRNIYQDSPGQIRYKINKHIKTRKNTPSSD